MIALLKASPVEHFLRELIPNHHIPFSSLTPLKDFFLFVVCIKVIFKAIWTVNVEIFCWRRQIYFTVRDFNCEVLFLA